MEKNCQPNNGEPINPAEINQHLNSTLPNQGSSSTVEARSDATAPNPAAVTQMMANYQQMAAFYSAQMPGFQQMYHQQQMNPDAYNEMVAKSFSQNAFLSQTPQIQANTAPAVPQSKISAPEQTYNANTASETKFKPVVGGKWIQYKSKEGYFYYYDSVIKKTQWEKPEDFDVMVEKRQAAILERNAKRKANALAAKNLKNAAKKAHIAKENNAMTRVEANGNKDEIDDIGNTFSVLSHEECVKMFTALLSEQEIPHDAEWAGILSDIIKDARYSAIKTLGERKKLFSEYCSEKKKENSIQKKKDLEKKMKEFYEVLQECETLDLNTKFAEVEEIFSEDGRFKDLKYIEKRTIFSRYRETLRKKEKEKAKKLYEENAPLFAELLKKSTKVRYNSEWEDIKEYFVHKECVKNLKAMERLSVFKKHKANLQKKHRKEKEERREKCKAQENAFEQLLDELAFDKVLFHSKSRWSELTKFPEFVNDERYKALQSDSSSRRVPSKLFERFCCSLEDKLLEDKTLLKKFLRKTDRRITVDDTTEKLIKYFKETAINPKIEERNLGILFLEMIAKAKFKKEKDNV